MKRDFLHRDLPLLSHLHGDATGMITLVGFTVLSSMITSWFRWVALVASAVIILMLALEFSDPKKRWRWLVGDGAYVLAWAGVIALGARWIR